MDMYFNSVPKNSKIAFCTTCMNRLAHLQQTLPKNLTDHKDSENCVFVLLDYGDSQGVAGWIERNHFNDIEGGRLVYYRFNEPESFHVSHAKNMAHRCGLIEGADILVNLDADNYTGIRLADFLVKRFASHENVFMRTQDDLMRQTRGIGGRIAMRKSDFLLLGGYDEIFDTWGIEDRDLAERLKKLGLTQLDVTEEFLEKITHSDEERVANYNGALTLLDVQQFINNRHQSLEGREHVLTVNTEDGVCYLGCGTVYRNFSDVSIEIKPISAITNQNQETKHPLFI